MRKVGAYLPGAHEEVMDIVSAFILTDKVTPPLAVIAPGTYDIISDPDPDAPPVLCLRKRSTFAL